MKLMIGCADLLLAVAGLGMWYYLLYNILTAISATNAMWTCYWIYVPMSFFGSIVMHIADKLPGDWE